MLHFAVEFTTVPATETGQTTLVGNRYGGGGWRGGGENMNTTGQRIKVAGSLEADRRRLVCAICPITALDHCWEKHAAVPDGTSLHPLKGGPQASDLYPHNTGAIGTSLHLGYNLDKGCCTHVLP